MPGRVRAARSRCWRRSHWSPSARWPRPLATVPWTLSLSTAGTIVSAALVVAVAASAERAGAAALAFRAFCIALALAGVASALIGLVQVFAPHLPDGNWIARGHLGWPRDRQPAPAESPQQPAALVGGRGDLARRGEDARRPHRGRAGARLRLRHRPERVAHRRARHADARRLGRARPAPVAPGAHRARARAAVLRAMWWGTSLWATHSHQLFAGQDALRRAAATSRPAASAIWSNALALDRVASLVRRRLRRLQLRLDADARSPAGRSSSSTTPTTSSSTSRSRWGAARDRRPRADALRALAGARQRDRRRPRAGRRPYPVQRAAFVIVFLVAVHSMLEYPLWYAYFLLPTAFAFGLCLERPAASEGAAGRRRDDRGSVTRPYVLAAMFLILGGTLARLRLHARRRHLRAARQRRFARAADRRRAQRASCSATTPTMPPRPSPSTRCKVMERVQARAALPARHPADDGVGEGARRARRDRQGALVADRLTRIPQRSGRGVLRALRSRRRVARARRRPSRAVPVPPRARRRSSAARRADVPLRRLPLAALRAALAGRDPVARLAAALLEHAHVADHHRRGRPPCTCRRSSAGRPGRR